LKEKNSFRQKREIRSSKVNKLLERTGNELLGRGESVVNKGISQVIRKVLEGTLSGDDSLNEESEHGEHSKTSVLDLLDLELSKSIGVVSESQGVEGTTGVESIKTLSPGTSTLTGTSTESLSLTHQDDEDSDGGSDGLGVDKVGVTEVVKTLIGEDVGLASEPDGLTEVDGAVALEELGDDASKSTEHGPASVDDLDLAVAGEGLGVSGHTGGIPAVVTGVLTLEVRGDVALREGAQELGAVCS
jgi:hypothetical protein